MLYPCPCYGKTLVVHRRCERCFHSYDNIQIWTPLWFAAKDQNFLTGVSRREESCTCRWRLLSFSGSTKRSRNHIRTSKRRTNLGFFRPYFRTYIYIYIHCIKYKTRILLWGENSFRPSMSATSGYWRLTATQLIVHPYI